MDKMKATLPATETRNGQWPRGNKEQTRAVAVVALKAGKFVQPITIRWWMGRSRNASTVYCSIWSDSAAGHGQAGGYGYDRRSAALAAAVRSAGISLSASISGVGDSAVREAVSAIARAEGYRKFTIVEL